MENQSTKLDKAVKISIIAGALIVGLSVAYYLVVYIPQRDKAKVERQKQEQQAKEQKDKAEKEATEKQKAQNQWALESCLSEAESSYWTYVKLNGTEKKDGTISAYNGVFDTAEKTKQSEITNCYRKYPQQ